MTYLRFILVKYLEAIMAALGLVIYPIAYLLRKHRFIIFWPWENSDEGDAVANWHGDRNWRNGQGFDEAGALKKFWIAYKWGALRNPSWNFKNWIGASARGEKSNVVIKINEGDGSGLLWMNKMYNGKKLAYFDVDDSKIRHFRYSFTRPLRWWSPWQLPLPRFKTKKIEVNQDWNFVLGVIKIFEAVVLFYWLEVKWVRTYENINFMAGTDDKRYLLKLRFFK